MNKVEIAGGLTRDAELRYTPNGAPVMNFTVAVNGARYDGQSQQQVVTTSFISVEVWGSLAEDLAEVELNRGSEVYVLGELTQSTTTKNDGIKEQKTRVKGLVVNVTRRRGGGTASRPAARQSAPMPTEPAYGPGEEPF